MPLETSRQSRQSKDSLGLVKIEIKNKIIVFSAISGGSQGMRNKTAAVATWKRRKTNNFFVKQVFWSALKFLGAHLSSFVESPIMDS